MIQFLPLQLSDKPIIDSLLARADAPICDCTFANIYMWQPTYHTSWAEVGGLLVVSYRLASSWGYMVAGDGDWALAYDALNEYVTDKGEALRLVSMSSRGVDEFRRWIDRRGLDERNFAIFNSRDYQDYIYSVEELCTFPGRRFQPKRNHLNRFASQYEYRFEPLRAEHFDACLHLECRWQRSKGEGECVETSEQCAIRRAFESYDELGLQGGVIIVEGHVVAFTFGSAISNDIFCTHVEKGDTTYDGVFPMVNNCFAKLLREQGFTQVNREEDMGIAGLRKSKLSYYPQLLQEKISVKTLSEEQVQCRELWMEVFGDEREWVDRYLAEYSAQDNMLLSKEQDRVVSMLHIVDITTDYGPTAYLYAIATDPAYRGRGYAKELISKAIGLVRERDYKAVMLIPSEPSLVEYYQRFGFSEPSYRMDFSNGFDFGTGDADRDIAMTLLL